MIATANLELSKCLQELAPGWRDTYISSYQDSSANSTWITTETYRLGGQKLFRVVSRPDLDWLLSRLPGEIKDSDGRAYRLRGGKNQYYYFEYQAKDDRDIRWWNVSPFSKESGCDAACALLIKLIEEKVIEV